MRKMFHGDWRFSRNRGAIQPQSPHGAMSIADSDVSRGCRLIPDTLEANRGTRLKRTGGNTLEANREHA